MTYRIALIHATQVAIDPIEEAFKQLWPEAENFNLLDDSLSPDLERVGEITPELKERFLQLSTYSLDCGADAILFTCSAFGSAIDYVKENIEIPVLKPNEAMIEDALAAASSITLVATFESAITSMKPEVKAMAGKNGVEANVQTVHVPGALEALRQGDVDGHDELIANAAASSGSDGALILAQFSMARAASRVRARTEREVFTSPKSSVRKLKALLGA